MSVKTGNATNTSRLFRKHVRVSFFVKSITSQWLYYRTLTLQIYEKN